jgi:hypothetical protein
MLILLGMLYGSYAQSMDHDQQALSVETMTAALLSADNFDRFVEKDKYCGWAFTASSSADLHLFESYITSLPNKRDHFLNPEGVSYVCKSPDCTHILIGFNSGTFAFHGFGTYGKIKLEKGAAKETLNIPVTAFAYDSTELDFKNHDKPHIRLVVGYQNGLAMFYDLLNDGQKQCAVKILNSGPINYIAQVPNSALWIFATPANVYFYDKNNFKEDQIFSIRRISISSLGSIEGIGTNMCNLIFKKGHNNYLVIMPYSAKERQQLFIAKSPELLKKYYDDRQKKPCGQVEQLQGAIAALTMRSLDENNS